MTFVVSTRWGALPEPEVWEETFATQAAAIAAVEKAFAEFKQNKPDLFLEWKEVDASTLIAVCWMELVYRITQTEDER